jgi:hypothetical protein
VRLRTAFLCSLTSLIFFLSSCGYHFSDSPLTGKFSTFSIPYIAGDQTGVFTNTLVYKMGQTGGLKYCPSGGDFCLKVCLLEPYEENIDYRYARNRDGSLKKIVVPHEARLKIAAEVSVIDGSTGKCVFGPKEIEASLAFDFESDFSRLNFHEFSLGQLEMHTLAEENAFPPLYSLLAQKIVDTLLHCW